MNRRMEHLPRSGGPLPPGAWEANRRQRPGVPLDSIVVGVVGGLVVSAVFILAAVLLALWL